MMNNCNRNPGANRGYSSIPTRHGFRGRERSYHEWKNSAQLWPRSPTYSWRMPAPGPRGLGPRVGMTIRQRLFWMPQQDYGYNPQDRVLVPIPQQHNGWSRPRGGNQNRRRWGSWGGNDYGKGTEWRGRGLWPNYPRGANSKDSVTSQAVSSHQTQTVTSTATNRQRVIKQYLEMKSQRQALKHQNVQETIKMRLQKISSRHTKRTMQRSRHLGRVSISLRHAIYQK